MNASLTPKRAAVLQTVADSGASHVLVKLTIPETVRIKAVCGISYVGYARFYGVWSPSASWAVKRAYSGRELVGAPTIKAALVDAKANP